MIVLGILGDIGSGKSFVAKQFNCPVFNADFEVNKIYKNNKFCYIKLKNKLPKFIKSFPISKIELSKAILENKDSLKKIINIVHPIIRKKMNNFLKKNRTKRAVVLDIPLYFENKLNKNKDVVVFIDSNQKRIKKALKKRQKTNTKLLKKLGILQISKHIKKKKSDYVIKNDFKGENLKKNIKILKTMIFKR